MPQRTLLFIDTNILLDFYRARDKTGIQLLKRAEKLSDRLIVTYQVEMEFKKNRQAAILEGMNLLSKEVHIPSPGIFSEARDSRIMTNNLREATKRAQELRSRLTLALEDPTQNDPVYQVCQRIFQKDDKLNLTRENRTKREVRRAALRRLLHGCPPGKPGSTCYGDAFNWEWMVRCAKGQKAGLVIASRDSDYGSSINKKWYVNDHLRHEFSDRVSRQRKLVLCPTLSSALQEMAVAVPAKERKVEEELLSHTIYGNAQPDDASPADLNAIYSLLEGPMFRERFSKALRELWKVRAAKEAEQLANDKAEKG